MSLFNDPNGTTPDSDNKSVDAPVTTTSIVDELVGEGKKFKTVEDALRGKVEADRYIEEMKARLAEAEAKAAKAQTQEELLAELRKAAAASTASNSSPNNTNAGSTATDTKVIGEKDIERLVTETITKKEREASAAANLRTTETKLKEMWGDDYRTKLQGLSTELGMSPAEMDALAAKSPSAFLRLVSPNAAPKTAPSKGTVNTDGFLNVPTTERTLSYYNNLRKTDPVKYWSASVQQEKQRQVERLGDAFLK